MGIQRVFCLIVWRKHPPERCIIRRIRRNLHLHLRFKGDTLNEITTLKLNKALKRTFPAAELRIWHATHSILPQQVKDKLPAWYPCKQTITLIIWHYKVLSLLSSLVLYFDTFCLLFSTSEWRNLLPSILPVSIFGTTYTFNFYCEFL